MPACGGAAGGSKRAVGRAELFTPVVLAPDMEAALRGRAAYSWRFESIE